LVRLGKPPGDNWCLRGFCGVETWPAYVLTLMSVHYVCNSSYLYTRVRLLGTSLSLIPAGWNLTWSLF